jgi:Na+/H+ antiporter NhaD/arsenite permease-like protein
MVMARVLTPTGLFEYLAGIALGLVRNDGRRLMMAVVIIPAPICAVLPNAAVVILVAPLIISICANNTQEDRRAVKAHAPAEDSQNESGADYAPAIEDAPTSRHGHPNL